MFVVVLVVVLVHEKLSILGKIETILKDTRSLGEMWLLGQLKPWVDYLIPFVCQIISHLSVCCPCLGKFHL